MEQMNVSKKNQLYTKIFNKVANMGFPKDVFLTESKLAEEFSSSRVSTREALITLCNDQILQNVPRIGYQIVQLSFRDISDAIKTRKILEVGAAREYIHSYSNTQYSRMMEKIDASILSEASNINKVNFSIDEWWKENIIFHTSIAGLSGNKLLTDYLEKIFNILARAAIQNFWKDDPESLLDMNKGSHKQILEAINNRDEEALVTVLTQDIEITIQKFQML